MVTVEKRLARSLVTVLFLTFIQVATSVNLAPIASAATFGSTACASDFSDTTYVEEVTLASYCVFKIKSGTTTWTPLSSIQSLYVLAVGGGGGGGNNAAGGGAGGAVAYGKYTVGATTNVTISVGAGGAGGVYPGNSNTASALMDGQVGGSTTVTANTGVMSLTAAGGTGGETHWADNKCGGTGAPANSVAGGAVSSSGAYTAITNSTGGTGGAWAASGSNGGAGGAGSARTITGATVYYGAGGGGGAWNGSGGAGGTGGGGAGGGTATVGSAGTANTGSGGGGGGDGCSAGGAGGSGIVILKWIPTPVVATPANSSCYAGRTAAFTTTVTSTTTLTRTYQWGVSTDSGSTYNAVVDGSGATTLTYTTGSNVKSEDGYRYRVGVTDADTNISTIGYSTGGVLTVNFYANFETDTALTLDGTAEYAQAVDNAVFSSAGALTVEAWAYQTSLNSGWNMVVNKEYEYELGVYGGTWWYGLRNSTTWYGVNTKIPTTLNTWQHVAFTRAAGVNQVKFYLNGQLAYTGTADGVGTGSINTGADYFTIGGRRSSVNSTGAFWPGQIDEVRVFGLARTAPEILSDMNTYGPIDATSLKVYYDFNEGTGTTLYNKANGAIAASDLTTYNGPIFNDVKTVDTTSQPAYNLITFNRTYITANGGWKSPSSQITYSALVVGGGGAGGARVSTGAGGGGGAGGMGEGFNKKFDTNTVVSIQVGQGGWGTQTGTSTTIAPGNNGQDSFIKWGATSADSFTALGGGGGAGGTSDVTSYVGLAGGSGGGASGSNTSGYLGGASLQTSANGFTGYGNAGGANPGCAALRPAGGGGGAGAVGVTPQTCSPAASGNGGAGRTSSITGSTYAGGGGGGASGDGGVTVGTGGTGGGADGSAGSLIPSTTEYIGIAGTKNTGGGGGGVGISTGIITGGAGGSGVVVIKYLITTRPVFSGLANDTTTAGLTYTFNITGTASSPFVRTYLWQSSSDTGTSWINISVGTGYTTASYTTPTLETTTSGARYLYRVVVTDTDGGTVLPETSTAVYLVINARISISGSYTPQKYGTSRTETFTVSATSGTGVKIIKRTSTAKSFITWDTSTANTARVTVAAGLLAGTYYDTLTVTDEETATTVYPVTITVLKADTATITVANRSDTYTASSLTYTDTYTVTGLVSTDSLTAVSYTYSGTANDGTTFANSARPAIAGTYSISPTYTLLNSSSYESVTVTTGTLTINRKPRTVSATTKPITLKYGESSTVIGLASEGTSDGSLTYASSTSSLCTFTGALLLAIDATGTCQFTTTMGRGNNYESATSTSYSATLAQADTITVTVESITALTYTGSAALVTPTIRVSGLVYTDTTTATSATFTYRSATSAGTFTQTKPTNSDTYTVRADTLTVTSGLLSRYKAITYVDGTLRINRAQQSSIYLIQYQSVFGTPYKALAYGGSGTGAYSYAVAPGTATGCSISTDTVTTTSEGSCLLTATRAQDQNYETKTATAYIYFLNWATLNPSPTPTSGPSIAISGATSVTLSANTAPTISSLSTYSATAGVTQIYINGAGFDHINLGAITVKFWRNQVASGFTVNSSDSQITVTVPAGATTGKITVTTPYGIAVSELPITISPAPIT